MKRKFKRFWKEWGISWEEFEMFIGTCGMIMIPIVLEIILSIFKIKRTLMVLFIFVSVTHANFKNLHIVLLNLNSLDFQ